MASQALKTPDLIDFFSNWPGALGAVKAEICALAVSLTSQIGKQILGTIGSSRLSRRLWNWNSENVSLACPMNILLIGHFWVHFSLHFKARLSAKSLLRKSVFIHNETNNITITNISHLHSLWKRDWEEFGNGLFATSLSKHLPELQYSKYCINSFMIVKFLGHAFWSILFAMTSIYHSKWVLKEILCQQRQHGQVVRASDLKSGDP